MLPPEMRENEFIRKAAELCERGAFTPEELDAYDKYWDIIRTERTLREGTRRDALEEGKAIGHAEGLEKGRTEEKEQVVLNAFRMGMTIEAISTLTGLTIEQTTEIQKRNGSI